jgi:hypothetical protein
MAPTPGVVFPPETRYDDGGRRTFQRRSRVGTVQVNPAGDGIKLFDGGLE